MTRPDLRTCLQLALAAAAVACVCVPCTVGVVVELGRRAIVWAWRGGVDEGGVLAGQDEDALDDGREW